MLRIAGPVVAMAMVSCSAFAQSHQPYAGHQSRTIKALSDEQLRDLREGRGAGLALAAELNGYPGPVHVLELARDLQLTNYQREQVEKLVGAMKAEAVVLGNRLVAQEADLEQQFANRSITRASLSKAMLAIATTQGALRETHLKYHLATVAVLSPHQVQRYSALRGYSADGAPHGTGGHPPRAH